jgi:ABC-2 type transport system ATP-binding protein
MGKFAIKASNLHKSYGKTAVLKGLNLTVQRGTMLALLGPNGAGKTTTVKILSTLLNYNEGKVEIEGLDLKMQPNKVRELIGLTGQSAAVDELLTGRENLIMMGRLYRLTKHSSSQRAQELLERFDLIEAGDRPAKTYSGGMRRRLDLAVSLIATPPIIFLDEPTTGLDPRSRLGMWDIIEDLKKDGSTILLTTQYLEEADKLADKIAVIDNGIVIAEGTADELKNKVGKDRLVINFLNDNSYNKAIKALKSFKITTNDTDLTAIITINDINSDVKDVLNILSGQKISYTSLDVHKPSLDDVFLSLTDKNNEVAKNEQ